MPLDNPLILDLETSVKNKGEGAIGGFAASPFCRSNRIVADGIHHPLYGLQTTYMDVCPYAEYLSKSDVVVAHHMQFDMQYLLRFYPEEFKEWLKTGEVWCTMIAEYLLTGMTSQFASLDDLAVKYGGTTKDKAISEYWEAGIDTEDIPKQELLDYLKSDVDNTRIVFEAQLKQAREKGMLQLIRMHMDQLIAVLLIEHNGFKYNVHYAHEEAKRLDKELREVNTRILDRMRTVFEEPVWDRLSLDSPDQVSIMLFGGRYSFTVKEPTIDPKTGQYKVYGPKADKAGQTVFKNNLVWVETSGYGAISHPSWKTAKDGIFKTGEDILKEVRKEYHTTKPFIDDLLLARELSKDLNTYFLGYTKLVYEDSLIHPNLNTTITATGRLSSSRPNMQNLASG